MAAKKTKRAAPPRAGGANTAPKAGKTPTKERGQNTTKAARKPAAIAADKPAKKRSAAKRARTDPAAVEALLVRAVPQPLCELKFESPFQLLISTILAAQSTDRTINSVAPSLYGRWPDAAALAQADQDEVEQVVKPTGFFRVKAKAIRDTAALLVEKHGGEVPPTMQDLVALKGVARKTANVVLGTAFGLNEGFVVDTHVARLSQRLQLTSHEDPVKIERDLCGCFARTHWSEMAHRFTLHGRHTCLARKPLCEECPLNELCPSREAKPLQDVDDRVRQEAERVRRALVITGVLSES